MADFSTSYNMLQEILKKVERIEQRLNDLAPGINYQSAGNVTGIDDDLYPDVKEFALTQELVSASLLQRKFMIGYARAARLLDILEWDGVIGPADGARPRDVLKK